ncbi:MAG: cation diffusion facilitator family transporter [Candidatus Omnitrophica bacterium]|nr:cation diffusion facilitator family transporter [Candidatus Omnitrophota bacterium]MDD5487425.1 cation diffusion facilitator family transporter [Candidatus Omnitrophota bacterium]
MTKGIESTGIDGQKQQLFAARVSMFGSIALFIISATVGIWVDSMTLILDASASLVILVTASLMHFSIKKIHCPPDGLYNFGYHKYEPLTVAVQNGLIIGTCVISVKYAIQDIVHAEDIHSYSMPAIATFLSGVLGVFITLYLKGIFRRTKVQMIKAASLHWLIDTVLSFSVCAGFLVGLATQSLGYSGITPYVDPVMAILLALFFVSMPFRGAANSLFELLDAAPGEDIRDKVKKAVERCMPDVFGVDRLRVRKAGQKVFVDVCFLVSEDLTVMRVEELADVFEKELKLQLSGCDAVVCFKPKR